ncbi:hypothetical protein PR202_ga29193 [Eleusine coracana subsp. coracana]|uniref:RRM domain-containing protein n=1 Tax=Eleusine coracana subsp. coracana TaxID=191504 RepID=A0AAV5DK73_ELECO|nr:hypothetical protein PR202_ga29193 [Eleusine coracana subsp. coracana]
MLPHQQLQQKQAAALMQQAAALQSMYPVPPPLPAHHPLLAAAAAPLQQIEPIITGNLPPGFDTSTCRSVLGVWNLQEFLGSPGKKILATGGDPNWLSDTGKSAYGFVDYYERRSAVLAILTLNGKQIFGQPIRVNWAYASGQREDTKDHFHIFVGDLSPEVTDSTLFACFSGFASCSDARVMWDHKTGRSKGYGFVSFRDQQDAQNAINDLNGRWLGTRQIHCNWATKGATNGEDRQTSDSKSVPDLTSNLSEDGKDRANEDAPENNPLYRTVYVGNLSHEVTQNVLHHLFYSLGAGAIEEVRVQYGKGFGFVRYINHTEAALAIQLGNGRIVGGKPIKCSWGNKPTPPGAASTPLPPPAASSFTDSDIIAYEPAMALNRMASAQALLHAQAEQLKQAPPMGMGAGASQAMYDGSYPNIDMTQQQLMYY